MTPEHVNHPDLLDSLFKIDAANPLYSVRRVRDKVVAATQSSQELFFSPELKNNLSLQERLWVAYFAAQLTPQPTLAAYYLEQLSTLEVDPALLPVIDSGHIETLDNSRLAAILHFTRTLINAPVEGDQGALIRLQDQGLSTEEIVVLAQLVAFLSYQVRLAAGLSALKSAGVAS
jgi:uncharacterized protein YciW